MLADMASPALLLPLLLLLLAPAAEGVITAVRLMTFNTDTTRAGSGRVEIQVNGSTWGYVCGPGWDDNAVSALCRQIGVAPVAVATVSNPAVFGNGTLGTFLHNIDCPPGTADLNSCTLTAASCTNDPVGAICNTRLVLSTTTPGPCTPSTDVRLLPLTGVPEGMGVVEVQHPTSPGVWGTICDDEWDSLDADVVCRMLCYHEDFAGRYYARPGGHGVDLTGASGLDFLLDNVQCTGNETDVRNCPHRGLGNHNCNPNERAAVTCLRLDSSAPGAPSPNVTCSSENVTVSFDLTTHPNLLPRHLTVNPPSGCSRASITSNATRVSVHIPLDACNRTMIQNATHIIYRHVIQYDHTNVSGIITYNNDYLINVGCELNRTANLTRSYTPQTEMVNVTSTGQYNLTMQFFLNDSFAEADSRLPLPIAIGEKLNVGISLLGNHDNVRLVVHNCWATPIPPSISAFSRDIILNKCIILDSTRIFPLNHTTFGFRFQTFKFTTSNFINVNCDAFVCARSLDTEDCDQSCNSSKPTSNYPTRIPIRRRRDVSSSTSTPRVQVTSPPVYLYLPGQQGSVPASPVAGGAATEGGERTPTARPGTGNTDSQGIDPVIWQWAPGQAGEATLGPLPQGGEATSAATRGREPPQAGEGGRPASQGGAELSLQSPVLVLEPPGGAASPAAVVSLGHLLLLLSVSVLCVSGLLL